jgi:hypothetical protein
VDSFDEYLALVKDPVSRMQAMLEKIDAHRGLKDWDGADKTIQVALSNAPEGKFNGELRLRAGEVEVGRGYVQKALKIFEAIPLTMEDDDICPRAIERAIELRRQQGDDVDVRKMENQLKSKYPEYLQKKNKK